MCSGSYPSLSGSPAGEVAFHYQAHFGPVARAWYTRFKLLVTGAVLPPEESEPLRENGTRLVAYEWTSAFYPGDPVSAPLEWQREVRSNAAGWLLNADPVSGGAAMDGKGAFWYDYSNSTLRARRAEYLADRLSHSSYDGFFFDTPGFEQLPPPMRTSFRNRAGDQDYNHAQGEFLRELRRQLSPDRIIFTNQGYRQPADFLPHADFDLSESYFTYQDGGRTAFRPWHDPKRPWESVRTPMDQLIQPASRNYPDVRFVHLNYAGGSDPDEARRAVRYSYVCAKLWNHESYLVAPTPSAEMDEIYFTQLGAPTDASYREDPGRGIAWRHFEHGLVAINSRPEATTLPSGHLLPPGPSILN